MQHLINTYQHFSGCLQTLSTYLKFCISIYLYPLWKLISEIKQKAFFFLFQGHTSWKSGRSSNYEWMWCVPSSCNQTDIQEALELSLDPLKVEDRVDMVVNVSCRTAETDRAIFDISDWVYMYVDLCISYSNTSGFWSNRKPVASLFARCFEGKVERAYRTANLSIEILSII